MHRTVDLGGTWRLSWSEDGPEPLIFGSGEGHMWLPARVPAPVHETLMENGLLEDPNFGMNSLRARWVEEQIWVYRRELELAEEALGGSGWLTFDWLEHAATVWLNGHEVGRHANSHRRAAFPVTGYLQAGRNTVVVAVESGLQEVNDVPVAAYGFDRYARMTRRPLLRKAQYQCGWDWNPRMMNVGILGGVRLECADVPVIDATSVVATVDPTLQKGTVICRVFVRWPDSATAPSGRVRVSIPETDAAAEMELARADDASTVTCHEIRLEVDEPELWWPAGQGDQRLYDVEMSLAAGDAVQTVHAATGFRRVEIDQSPHPDGGRHFIVCVNGRRIFCKGGNWVPPDLMPARVPAERYEALVAEAVTANFNTLRVWGGGVFAPPALLDACDRLGVLVWHDLLFACAKYPGDDPAFVTEVEAEVTEAVRRMAHHPSLIVWCGNNEVEWGDREWGYRHSRPVAPHHALFHQHIPAIVQAEDGSRPYWPSSPWSPDFDPPNDPTTGDQHPWGVSIGDPGPADFYKYRRYVDRFPNEGGVLGAGLPVTLREFLPPNEQRLLSPSWVHHDNPIAYRGAAPDQIGRTYETFRLWTGLDPFEVPLDEYALLSGLLQAEGLSEYIANYRRRMFSSSSAIFWMYNDSWPASHSWTILDWHLRRRLAYHPVRRAFQPVTVVVADEGDRISWYGINETQETWRGALRCGLFLLAGGYPVDECAEVELPPNASVRITTLPRTTWEELGTMRSGAFGLLMKDGQVVAQHRLFLHRFHEMEMTIEPLQVETSNGQAVFECPAFTWGVCVDIRGGKHVSDNCFDLLPGLRYTLQWPHSGEPQAQWVGSHALIRALQKQA